jgi:glycosyltransferase involved in cell wall biosynthesis
MSDRIPVGIFLTNFDAGGTEGQMLTLAERLDPRRFRVHLACFTHHGPWASRATRVDPDAGAFPLRGLRRPSTGAALLRYARWCARRRLAIVQTAGLHANIFGLSGAALARVPVRIASRRNVTSLRHSPALQRLQRLSYKLAHAVVANSSAAADAVVSDGVPRDKVIVIPNGIDIEHRPACHSPGSPRLIVVANFRPEKGHDLLVAAARRIVDRRPDAVFQLVGNGPLLNVIREHVRRAGLGHAFEFLGQRTDVPHLLASAGLLLLPSRTEALPNAVLEAMAAALPVVATAVGGVPELIEHDRTGLLVPPENAEALADAALTLLNDTERARRLGEDARKSAERFRMGPMVAAYERLYLAMAEAARWNR